MINHPLVVETCYNGTTLSNVIRGGGGGGGSAHYNTQINSLFLKDATPLLNRVLKS